MLEKAKNDASYIVESARYKSGALLGELEEIKKKFSAENAAELYGKAKGVRKKALDSVEEIIDPISEKASDDYKYKTSITEFVRCAK